jgi:D-lactate dehydrogenase
MHLADKTQAGVIHLTEAEPGLRAKFELGFAPELLSTNSGTIDVHKIPNKHLVQTLCITARSKVGKDEMDALPNLRLITTGSVGIDHIDFKEARRRGITVCNVPEYGSAVAEFNIALMMVLSRRLHLAFKQITIGNFTLDGLLGRNVEGRVLGIIGAGNIGIHLARLASSLGMTAICVDPNPRRHDFLHFVTLPQMLAASDIIAICCPLTPKTTHLIGHEQFLQMKRGVLIVNTSRGAVLDTHALLWALNEGIVEGAALDVMEGEVLLPPKELSTLTEEPNPVESQSPAQDLTLMHHPKVIVTPHMAYYTQDSLDRIRQVTLENVKGFLAGIPQNIC